MTTRDLEGYVTIPEFVKLGLVPLGETTLYELARVGKVRSYRVGKKVFVLPSEVWDDIRRVFGPSGVRRGVNRI